LLISMTLNGGATLVSTHPTPPVTLSEVMSTAVEDEL
jgi:hypothetical protein